MGSRLQVSEQCTVVSGAICERLCGWHKLAGLHIAGCDSSELLVLLESAGKQRILANSAEQLTSVSFCICWRTTVLVVDVCTPLEPFDLPPALYILQLMLLLTSAASSARQQRCRKHMQPA
jgi:hypothetical protein